MYENEDNEILCFWVERGTRLDLSVKEKKKKLSPKPPFPSCTVLFSIRLGGRAVFLNCLLCLNTFFFFFFVVQVLFCVLGPNSCQ